MITGLWHQPFSRRHFLTGAGLVTAAGMAPGLLRPARAATKVLRIMQWNHFVPAFDEWFNKTFIKEWGERNDTEVIVTNVGMTAIEARAAAEIKKGHGHDICMFLSPPASYEDQVIDHKDIYAECERRFGKPLDVAIKSTFNPVTGKYFGFSDGYVPDPVNYRKDLWDEVGIVPDSWEAIREGGARSRRRGVSRWELACPTSSTAAWRCARFSPPSVPRSRTRRATPTSRLPAPWRP